MARYTGRRKIAHWSVREGMACLWSSIRTTGSSRDASRGADDENEDSAAWRQAREYRDTVGVGERLRNNDGDGLARSEIFAVAALVNVAARPNPATRPSRLALPASSHPDTPLLDEIGRAHV